MITDLAALHEQAYQNSVRCDRAHDDNARQDIALTELESRLLDMERAVYERPCPESLALAERIGRLEQRIEQIARVIARTNLRLTY